MAHERGIDIVVVGYHQPVDCREFHGSLFATSDQTSWNAVYVSVEATDEDMRLGNELYGPENHLICVTNLGHAGACNIAASSRTEYDTLFFCNADTRLSSGVIDRCYETLWSDESYGVIGPRQVDEQGRITAAGIFGTHAAPRHRGWHERTEAYQDLRDDAVMVAGSLYMIKRHVWDELAECPIYRSAEPEATGAMPSVRHYFSDTWPSYHMTAHGPDGGYKSVYEGRVTARHDWHKASPQGGFGEQNWNRDKNHFRRLCDAHALPHD